MWFLIGIFILPVIEIRSFMWVAAAVGVIPALLLAILLAIVGAAILRAQGLMTLLAAQQSMMAGEMPSRTLFDGLCLFLSGIFLIIPGFFTDLLAFGLMAPQVRGVLFRIAQKKMDERAHPRDPSVIEGEYVRLDRTPIESAGDEP